MTTKKERNLYFKWKPCFCAVWETRGGREQMVIFGKVVLEDNESFDIKYIKLTRTWQCKISRRIKNKAPAQDIGKKYAKV